MRYRENDLPAHGGHLRRRLSAKQIGPDGGERTRAEETADFGVEGSAIIGRSHYEVFPDIPERWKEIHRRALSGETVRAGEDPWERPHGTVWVQWEIRPWKTDEGAQGGILIFAVDISAHKQMQAAMRGFCRNFAAGQKVDIHFEAGKINGAPAPDVSLCLLRVLQEALHNAAKHSHVRHFDVRLACSTNELNLQVSDQGAGFDLESAMRSGGLGLSSMRERVRLIHGTISIDSKPRGGTTIRVRAPLAVTAN